MEAAEPASTAESKPRRRPPPPPLATRWKPGQSGNPKGRAPTPPEVRRMALEATPEALRTAIEIMRDPDQGGATRLKAAEIVLERALGRPEQAVNISGSVDATDAGAEQLRALQRSLVAVLTGAVVEAVAVPTDALEGRQDALEAPPAALPAAAHVGDPVDP